MYVVGHMYKLLSQAIASTKGCHWVVISENQYAFVGCQKILTLAVFHLALSPSC